MNTVAKPGFLLTTERLRLRHVREDDADALLGVYGDPQAMRFFPKVYSREEILATFIRPALRRYGTDGHSLFAVELPETGEVIGLAGPILQDGPAGEKMIEVGYHFNPRYWGHGYATEAARLSVRYAFGELKAPFVVSFINPGNTPSQRVAQRNGLKVWTSFEWHGGLHDVWRIERADFEELDWARE